eukprot:CAMPEP_0182537942 /NCGR_PEP_ID=MMETSP1323-20130603/22848_1 /TAXON_ID=236787 /ORGANISM="Florenciella parvula, Strain RCC1693" /LENGTH=41 /DNA_ID= /DNA_START= /DNA_END= /DNA_ORIENTATION=
MTDLDLVSLALGPHWSVLDARVITGFSVAPKASPFDVCVLI